MKTKVTLGTLFSSHGAVVVEICTLDWVRDFLRQCDNGRGWSGGPTVWRPWKGLTMDLVQDIQDDIEFQSASGNFAETRIAV